MSMKSKMRTFNTVRNMFSRGEIDKKRCDMTFDWELAARLIKNAHPFIAHATLEDSWNLVHRVIYQGGFHVYSETVHSDRKRPMIVIDGGEPIPCFKMEYDTNGMEPWPKEALEILEGDI